MADYLEPSPRASKRRRTTTYKAARSVLEGQEDTESEADSVIKTISNRGMGQQNGFDDSAYGSKEDSLLEDEAAIDPAAEMDLETEPLVNNESSRTSDDQTGQLTEESRGQKNTPPPDTAFSEDEDNTVVVQPRSSGRERRRPRRYSISPEKPRAKKVVSDEGHKKVKNKSDSDKKKITPKATPKGILTPSRKEKRTGPPKSVLFNEDSRGIEKSLGFKDIETSTPKNAPLSKPRSKEDTDIASSESPLTLSGKAFRKNRDPVPEIAISEIETNYDELLAENLDEDAVELVGLELEESVPNHFNIDDDDHVLKVKSEVLTRLISRGRAPIFPHLQTQYNTLHAVLHATATSGESNSLLLLGGRGSGKTHLLETVISDLNLKHPDAFHTVRLNGFYQTDDKLALREIWRQLGREMYVSETETGQHGGSYADTMSSLLSLLSHPDDFNNPELTAEDSTKINDETIRVSRSIIFILDEFDLFTTHPRQTLLYNLFDIAQSKKAPIAVVGCSTRMDVVDCLEKRVKSRFSHRWLHVPSAKTLDEFQEIVKNAVCLQKDKNVTLMRSPKETVDTRERWNEYVQSTFLSSPQIQQLIRRAFYTTKSIPDLFVSLYSAVATISLPSSKTDGTSRDIRSATINSTGHPTLLTLLPSLPTLHLALLIAASRLDTIHNMTTLNLNLVYAHYAELISRSKLQITASGAVAVGASLRQWSREIAECAWEDLGLYECIVPVSGLAVGAGNKDSTSVAGDCIGGEGASVRMWRIDVTLEDLVWVIKEKWSASGGLRDVLLKWCKEV